MIKRSLTILYDEMVFMCTLLFDRGVVGFASPDHAGFLGADLRLLDSGRQVCL